MEPWVPHGGLDRLLERHRRLGRPRNRTPRGRVIGVGDRSDVSASPAGDALRWITPGGAFGEHRLIRAHRRPAWFAVAATPQGPTASLRKLGEVAA